MALTIISEMTINTRRPGKKLKTRIGISQPELIHSAGMCNPTIFCVGKVTQSGSGCQVGPGSVPLMRIKALNLLDSPPPNRCGEFHEISVPFGLAPAEQIVRPERTNNSLTRDMRYTRDLRSILRTSVLSELTQT